MIAKLVAECFLNGLFHATQHSGIERSIGAGALNFLSSKILGAPFPYSAPWAAYVQCFQGHSNDTVTISVHIQRFVYLQNAQ